MKTYQKILVIIIILISYVQLQSQWIDKGSYKELQASTTSISQLLTPKGENYFYIVDKSGNFKKYNYYGDSVFWKKFVVPNGYSYIRCSDDAKSYNIGLRNDIYGDPYYIMFNLKANDIYSDSTFFDKNIKGSDYLSYMSNPEAYIFYCDYNKSSGSALCFLNIYFDYYYYRQHFSSMNGKNYIFNNSLDSGFSLPGINTNAIAYTDNYNNLFSGGYSYSASSNDDGSNSKISSYFSCYYFNKLEDTVKGIPNVYPRLIRLANNDNIFAAVMGSTIFRYKYLSDTVYCIDTLSIEPSFNNMIFSSDNKYYIVTTPANTIDLYHIESKTLAKSYQMLDSIVPDTLSLTQDGKGFLASNSKGTVKYFRPDYFSDSMKALISFDKHITQVSIPIHFYNLSTGNYDSYYWDLGDGNSSLAENPVHEYSAPGTFFVRLVVWNSKKPGSSDFIDSVLVLSKIKADFNADIIKGDFPLNVQFNDLSKGTVKNILWIFGDGDSSSELNPFHTYLMPGIYPVKLIVNDGYFTDSLTKYDYITVNQIPITDTTLAKEKVFWMYNENLQGLTGFEVNSGGYLVESVTGEKNHIFRFNNNFDTLWTRSLYTSIFHSPMQQTDNGTVYVIGNETPESTTYTINRINDEGDISFARAYSIQGNDIFVDFLATDNWYYLLMSSTGIYQMGLEIEKSNMKDIVVKRNVGYPGMTDNDRTYLTKPIAEQDDRLLFLINCYEPNEYTPSQYAELILFDSTLDFRSISGRQQYLYNSIFDFIELDTNSFLFMRNNNEIRKFNRQLIYSWTKTIPDAIFYSLVPISETQFAVCGSKSGNCWYAIMDTTGNVIEEHTITERFGWFNHVSLNKDGSLLLIGSIYKNSFESKVVGKNHDETILTSQNDNNGLYIFKTIPFHFTDVKETNPYLDCKIYPNPSNGFVNFLINLPTELHIRLVITDMLGNQVATLADGFFSGERKFTFNSSQQSSGVFFYRLQIGSYFQSGKFMIIK